jgi:hypothetical protein
MAFIVEQQSQFASDIRQLQESQSRTDQVVAQTAELVGQTGEVVTRLANVTHAGCTEVNAKINAVVDGQIRTEENWSVHKRTLYAQIRTSRALMRVLNTSLQ